ncbi:DNA-directed RNA polymerase subunit D [Candidatus Woesearchaeota archaeon]|nr:DNA-directed RNA polymerase subunit D [Candidatus Woesearchaeota archaeon]
MKLEKIKEERKKNKLTFLLKGSTDVFANAIRRLIVEEVPTLAVEDVEVRDNSSALYDEMLALRLGLLPISTDLKSYQFKEGCSCQGAGCAQCELKITLKVARRGYVYAEEAKSADPKCTFVYPKTPIVKLLPKQKIDVTMTAILGKGKEHTKWSSGWAIFMHEHSITVGKVADAQAIMKKCTDGVFTLKGNTLSVNEEKVYESQLLEFYSSLDKGIAVEYSDNIIFTVESWGQLSCREMLQKSADILLEKVELLEKAIA